MNNYLNVLISDLREKRLWPVAAVLLIALLAVPVLLSSKSSGTPVAQVPPLAVPVTQLAAYPAVSVQTSPAVSDLPGNGRDPFTQQKPSGSPTTSSATTTTTSTPTSTTPLSGIGAGSGTTGTLGSAPSTLPTSGSGGSGTSPSSGSGGTTTSPTTSTPSAPPAPPALAANEAYHVTVAITNAGGGLDSIDPLERLSLLPSGHQPLLVELGVLKGGGRVLFAVQPGTVVSGPGSCTPGPIDCEILALGRDQVEQLSKQSTSGTVSVGQFAVTAIKADQFSSAAAANQARNLASASGRHLLSKSTLSALSLFQYEPSVGAVVDLRNLTVGGN